jgi:hypothetical protein
VSTFFSIPHRSGALRGPTPMPPCPDAWCLKCDEAFRRLGEWNEENEAVLSIQLICSGCYLRLRSNSLAPL